jgi:hypothetical protein
MLGIHACN